VRGAHARLALARNAATVSRARAPHRARIEAVPRAIMRGSIARAPRAAAAGRGQPQTWIYTCTYI